MTERGAAIDRHLAAASARISRVEPVRAAQMLAAGALLVDLRAEWQRREHGDPPGAIWIPRTVLEWRVDPTSPHRHPALADHDGPLVVCCQQGYSSILAVATLVDLGVPDVHELAGGVDAWIAAGLPMVPATVERPWDPGCVGAQR
jgi:rhodanese-related sulfurtransferase